MSSSRRVLALAATTAMLAVLAGCGPFAQDDEPTPSPSASASASSDQAPKGTGEGDITGTVDGKDMADTWVVTCFDDADTSVSFSSVGTPPNTIQGKLAGTDLVRFTVSAKDVLASADPDGLDRLKVERTPDGFTIRGDLVQGSSTLPVDLQIVCGE